MTNVFVYQVDKESLVPTGFYVNLTEAIVHNSLRKGQLNWENSSTNLAVGQSIGHFIN